MTDLLTPSESLSEYPGCVYCMSAGTSVKQGEICPVCNDRLPTQAELDETITMLDRLTKPESLNENRFMFRYLLKLILAIGIFLIGFMIGLIERIT